MWLYIQMKTHGRFGLGMDSANENEIYIMVFLHVHWLQRRKESSDDLPDMTFLKKCIESKIFMNRTDLRRYCYSIFL